MPGRTGPVVPIPLAQAASLRRTKDLLSQISAKINLTHRFVGTTTLQIINDIYLNT
jgi:hypothetical protein